jgi:hypothetical protein
VVLAEAACCGSVPLSADHSGLGEVTALLSPAVARAGFGWEQVAAGVAEAARGQLAELPLVPAG